MSATATSTPRRDLKVREFAEAVGCTPETVRKRIRDGQLDAYKFGNQQYRVRSTELDRIRNA